MFFDFLNATDLLWLAPFAAAFSIGFLGGLHCIGMCGGVMAALSFSLPADARARRWGLLLSYNAGRIGSYCLIGALAGLLGFQLSGGHGISVLRLFAGLLLIAMGLYLANWWRGLVWLERGGSLLWRYLQPLGNSLMPVRTPGAALLLGGLWGWLPCGLVYTALAYALAQADGLAAMGVMLAFGLGTLPSVLAAGVFAERLKAVTQLQSLRTIMALCIMAFGLWTLWATAQHAGHAGHGGHAVHSQPAASESEPEDAHKHHHHH